MPAERFSCPGRQTLAWLRLVRRSVPLSLCLPMPHTQPTAPPLEAVRSRADPRRIRLDDAPAAVERPTVRGPFLWLGDRKLTVKGVTYGTFAAAPSGDRYPARERVRSDMAAMRQAGFNTVRTYTTPPNWFLDEARAAGLRVLVGIHWEGRDCRFDDPESLRDASAAVREAVSRCKHHPDVVLAYVIANEIPPLVTRFHGRRVIERFLFRLFEAAKEADPDGLVTYGNYPSTEFLQLDFLDFHTLNVYLLDPERLAQYLDRMLIQTKGKPLLLGEVGDDSNRPGEQHQAEILDWTIPLALQKGVAGLCIFSWTDEWVVGEHRVADWAFGLVDAKRRPKPALEVVRRRLHQHPLEWRNGPWPKVSVVVCNYNGAATLADTLASLLAMDYPDHEIIYVDDGSTDDSLAIARRFRTRIRIIAQENRGLSAARNVGAEAATGDIVAYIDSDAFADRDWLRYLVLAMESGDFVAAGGPNLTPASDGLMAQFIAMCPGNPTYVLKDNVRADHIAGVNMAFRRSALLGIGGFDPLHRKAGDDVDVCWRLEDAGMHLAFSPAAIVWHHRRPSLARYLKQQYGYGEAENQLERKHPERFNLGGYIRWGGKIYIAPKRASALFKPFIYHGRLGLGMFQTLYQKDPSYLSFGPAMIHWYFAWTLLLVLSPLSPWLLVVAAVLFLLSVWVAFVQGFTTEVPVRLTRSQTVQKVWVVSLVHFLHPVVRWWGRVAPRVRRTSRENVSARPHRASLRGRLGELFQLGRGPKEARRYWGVRSTDREEFLRSLHREFKLRRMSVAFGQEWDNFDLSLNGSFVAEARFYSAPEHYDQSICCGFKAYTSRPVRFAIAATLLAAIGLSFLDPRFGAIAIVPVLLLYRVLGERARLREATWEAVATLMERRGAKEFQRSGAS